MSDTLQLVEFPNTQLKRSYVNKWSCVPVRLIGGHHDDKLKRIGHSLSHCGLIEW